MREDSAFRFIRSTRLPELTLLQASMDNFHYDRHAHEEYCFGVTLRGRQDFFSAGAYHRSLPGHVIRFNPGQVHDGASGAEEPLNYVMLYIQPDAFESLANVAGACSKSGGALLDDTPLRQCILDLARLIQDEAGSQIEQEYALYRIAARIQQLQGRYEENSCTARPDRLLREAQVYIRDNINRDLALDDISQAASLSKYHFLRLFRRQFGMTPHQYVLNCRINAARRALDDGLPLNDVVHRYAFYDLSHFNRRFKRIYGMTPRQYQRSIGC